MASEIQRDPIPELVWMIRDALSLAANLSSRACDATQGDMVTCLFDAARKEIQEFSDKAPAMIALRHAATVRRLGLQGENNDH